MLMTRIFGVEAMVIYCKFYMIAPRLDKTIVKSNEMPSLVQIEALIKFSPSCSQKIYVRRREHESHIYWKDRHGT